MPPSYVRRSFLVAALLLTTPSFSADGARAAGFARGDLVEARSRAEGWGPAYVLAVDRHAYRVHFEGKDDRFDETLPSGRLRARATMPARMTRPPEGTIPPAASDGMPSLRFRRGDRVDVFWGDVFWKAIVRSAEADDRYLVHYDGWPEDDEVVPRSRMRPYSAKPADGPYAAAFAALARKDYTVAKERFRHALSQSEGDPDLWRGAARMHRELGENEDALAYAAKLVAAEPRGVAGWVLKGECHAALGQDDEARAAFENALHLDPEDAAARWGAAALRR